jgi:hypothetical protein
LRRFSPNNRIPWGEVVAVNGEDLPGIYAFLVRNPEVVEGQDVRREATEDSHSDWLRLKLGLKNGTEKTGFVNYTWETARGREVVPFAPIYHLAREGMVLHNGLFQIKDGEGAGNYPIGKVDPLFNLLEDSWSDYMAAKLRDQISLDIGDYKYNDATIFPDYPCEMREKARSEVDLVAIHGTPFPIARLEQDREPVAFVPWDTKIKSIITANSYFSAYTLRGYLDSEVFNEEGKEISLPDKTVLRIGYNIFSKPKGVERDCTKPGG